MKIGVLFIKEFRFPELRYISQLMNINKVINMEMQEVMIMLKIGELVLLDIYGLENDCDYDNLEEIQEQLEAEELIKQ